MGQHGDPVVLLHGWPLTGDSFGIDQQRRQVSDDAIVLTFTELAARVGHILSEASAIRPAA